MNPYAHEAIANDFDIRLVDCFVKQNPDNKWLSPKTVASWMFQTNSPTPLQVSYCQRKVASILGMMFTSSADRSFLEKGRLKGNTYSYVYRLKKEAVSQASSKRSHTPDEEGVELVFAGREAVS